MKDTKYKILAYFDNQSYRKLFNEINSDYAENLQILLHNLSLFSYDVLIIGVILYKEKMMGYAPKEISHHMELPEQTVYTRLRRLREKIKKSMKFE